MAPKIKAPDPAQRDVFDSGARARTRNPETSKAAAQSVRSVRASHQRVLAMFRAYGDMTDETLAAQLDDAAKTTGVPRMSPSGVRSRRSELSKPNMDRLGELARDHVGAAVTFADCDEGVQGVLRIQLRHEGFRSPLWDTGKRETLSTGRQAIVWGIAR